jgi:hypothetical protein
VGSSQTEERIQTEGILEWDAGKGHTTNLLIFSNNILLKLSNQAGCYVREYSTQLGCAKGRVQLEYLGIERRLI